ncbi:MAG: hypothetical protein HYS53_03675 [Candidatus Aenigmarchaeota archaeon]|nr:hypothetical protein [Candidatus Aenigmarchaeota archaeon]
MKSKHALLFTTALIAFFILVNNVEQEKPAGNLIKDKAGYATMLIPAVDEEGGGVITNLTVQVKPGAGRSLVDINELFFWVDTQNSIRTAKDVAEKFTGANLQDYDIVYSIVTNASAVEGPSAGAAIAVATIAAIENKKLRDGIMITGTINPDGSIGKVGDVLQKAGAAKSSGAKVFLVPVGQSFQTTTGYEKTCKSYLLSKVCSSRWAARNIDIESSAGIEVVEVTGIKDAIIRMVVE